MENHIAHRYLSGLPSQGRRLLDRARDGKSYSPLETVEWCCRAVIQKFDDPLDQMRDHASRMYRDWEHGALRPYEIAEWEGNLLMTVGATDLWNGLVTAGLATPYNSTNAGLAVGDSNTAASAGQTDLQAAAGSGIQTSGFTSVTNATPIVITNGSGNWSLTPAVGSVVVVSGITTETAANGTFEVSASTATTVTLLNSAGNGVAGSLASGVMKAINRYLQTVNGAPSVSTNQVQFVAVFASANANFAWNEFATVNGMAATNKQTAPPSPHMSNRAVASLGTKANGTAWTFTESITLA